MSGKEISQGRQKNSDGDSLADCGQPCASPEGNGTTTGILDERIESLREAIDEIDGALAARRELNRRFVVEIHREAAEVKRQLDMLPAPWRTGFQPEQKFLRLSFQRRVKSD